MKSDEFNQIVNEQMDRCLSVLKAKDDEYSKGKDRLHNFKVSATLQHNTPIQALAGQMAKHTTSVYDLCMDDSLDLNLWNEKITDNINYLLILRALIEEDRKKLVQGDWSNEH